MQAPTQVKRAVILLWSSLAIGIVDTVLSMEPMESEDASFDMILWTMMGVLLVFIAALIYLISRRHNWARITYLVLTVSGWGTYIFLPLDIDAEPWWSLVLTGAATALDLAALYLLFTGSGARWYSSKAAGAAA